MKPLGPYLLSATNPQPFNVEWDQVAQPPIGVDIQNQSSLLLQLQISGQTFWLTPWTARYFPVGSQSTYVAVRPSILTTPSSGDPLTITATVYQVGDMPPVVVERALTGLAVASAISGSVTTRSDQLVLVSNQAFTLTAGNGYSASFPVTIPSWALSLGITAQISTPIGGQSSEQLQLFTLTNNGLTTDQLRNFPWSSTGSGFLINFGPAFLLANSGDDHVGVEINAPTGGGSINGHMTVTAYSQSPIEMANAGPTDVVSLDRQNAASTTLLSAGKVKIWNADISVLSGGSGNSQASIQWNGKLLLAAPSPGTNSVQYEGGMELYDTNARPVTLAIVGTTVPFATASVAYSLSP